jgi:hypothetical protein
MLEIGVGYGVSLAMWLNYFGVEATIHGLDSNPKFKRFEGDRIRMHIGRQEDREFLARVREEIPKLDVVIDDGGHRMEQQIVSFEELYGHVSDHGVYIVEDLSTSYKGKYGGGYQREGTFIEFSKTLIDHLNARHHKCGGGYNESTSITPTAFTRTTNALHFYDMMLVVEKRRRTRPRQGRLTEEDLRENKRIIDGLLVKTSHQ